MKKKALKFDYSPGDVVSLSDGRLALIVKYGIYSNQYWCEVVYPDGLHLAAADHFSTYPTIYGSHISRKGSDEEKERVIEALKKQANEYKEINPESYKSRFEFMKVLKLPKGDTK